MQRHDLQLAKGVGNELYAGIDLHSKNSVVSVIDEHDLVVMKRLPEQSGRIIVALVAFGSALVQAGFRARSSGGAGAELCWRSTFD